MQVIENADLSKYSLSVQNTLYLNLGILLFEKKLYKKAIYFLFKSLGNILSVIEYFENFDLEKAFIKSRHGDLIKEYILNAINLEFNKSLSFLKIDDVNAGNKHFYFDLASITDALTDEEIDSVLYVYNEEKRIKNIEELISLINDDYKVNLDNILKFISDQTLAEKGFIILYDRRINEYSILSSLKEEGIEEFNLNKLIYLDRKREGILLNKNSAKTSNQSLIKSLSKEYIAVLGVPIGVKTDSSDLDLHERKSKLSEDRYLGYIYLETNSYMNKFNRKKLQTIREYIKVSLS